MDTLVLNGSREISKSIQIALDTDDGVLIGRNGSIELGQMLFYNKHKLPILETNAGIFPQGIAPEWRLQSIDATKEANILCTGWYEPLKEEEQAALKEWN